MAAGMLFTAQSVFAMNLNLAMPFGDQCSPPQTPYLSFYSPQADDLLFQPKLATGPNKSIVIVCQSGLRSSGLSWTLNRNMVRQPIRQGKAEALPANQFRIPVTTDDLTPGFYDLRVTLDTGVPSTPKDRRPVTGVCTFGWRVAEMPIRETRPADFKAFWERGKAKMAGIPLDARMETPMQTFTRDQINAYNLSSACLPPDYDPTGHKAEVVESCKISFAGPDGGRVYAWLAKPVGPGPFPAMIVLPGAGFAARPRPLEHARHGYLTIDMQVHGQDVDLPSYPSLPGYYDNPVYTPVEGYYYYNVHLRVEQAVNYMLSRPDVDAKRLVVAGGSQGGRLGIVIAGFDSRVKAVVSCIANSPNYPHLRWVMDCNKVGVDGKPIPGMQDKLSNGVELKGAPPAVTTPDGVTMAYYDPMNFAPDIKCPVYMNAGLVDPVSPPYSTFAVYNRLAVANKTIVPLPGLGHDWSAEFDRRAWRWLDTVLVAPKTK
jgi:cephalosporin-C deacetylase-like acetyl esterase